MKRSKEILRSPRSSIAVFHYAEKACSAQGLQYWPVQRIDGKLCATERGSTKNPCNPPRLLRLRGLGDCRYIRMSDFHCDAARTGLLLVVSAAVARHKSLQLALSIGDQLQPREIGPVPSNAIIVKRAPQLELLKQTSVSITHAGLNTVLEALTQGVPQVAIPVTNDQPGVAARIADKKTGVITSLDKFDRVAPLNAA
jgi:hypothetical protein